MSQMMVVNTTAEFYQSGEDAETFRLLIVIICAGFARF